jgi:hypothetical protein
MRQHGNIYIDLIWLDEKGAKQSNGGYLTEKFRLVSRERNAGYTLPRSRKSNGVKNNIDNRPPFCNKNALPVHIPSPVLRKKNNP